MTRQIGAGAAVARPERTVDPTRIQSPSQIPLPGARFAGPSAQRLVDVYHGTLLGDTDARPAAKELLGTAPSTEGQANADYIYNQVSALYGGAHLPSFRSPSGNSVKSLVFVSGSSQGGYGAFHLAGTQADFDRIVVDSLNLLGSYSAGSGLGTAMASVTAEVPHLFPMYRGIGDLHGIVHVGDLRLEAATPATIREALALAAQSTSALRMAVEARNTAAVPPATSSHITHLSTRDDVPEARRLIHANQDILGLIGAAARAIAGRRHLSTALFAAEIVESFQMLTGKADPGKTDGEAVSRIVAFKLAPEIALIPGFNSAVTQQWWLDGQPDFVNVNSESDQSVDGNAAGVMFLEFLTDYLGVPIDRIFHHMPSTRGAPLGETYVGLLKEYPEIAQVAGRDGVSAFRKMVSLLQQNTQTPDGSLNLPADGNPFPSMPGAKQGGLFAVKTPSSSSLAQDARAALGLQSELDQQLASLKAALQRIQGDVSGGATPGAVRAGADGTAVVAGSEAAIGYGPPLVASLVASLEQRVAPYRTPHHDQTLQEEFWPHVYNELPGTGPHTDRLQVITGTNRSPLAVQITGTITQTRQEPDGDLQISFQPDDANFPTNQGAGEPPLELEIIYASPVTQSGAKQAETGYTNPFDISQLAPGTRIQATGPLVFNRAYGKPASDGKNVETGLQIHPLGGMTVLSGGSVSPPSPSASQLPNDLISAIGQVGTLSQTLGSLKSLLQRMKGGAPIN